MSVLSRYTVSRWIVARIHVNTGVFAGTIAATSTGMLTLTRQDGRDTKLPRLTSQQVNEMLTEPQKPASLG